MSGSNGNGEASAFSIIGERTIPETYADSLTFEAGPYGITLVFSKVQHPPASYQGKPPTTPRMRVHMSPQHAKVMALAMHRLILQYEEQAGHINLPKGLLEEIGLEDTPREDNS